MTSYGKRATRTALAAVALVASVPGILPSARAGPELTEEPTPGIGRGTRPADAGYVELQRQLIELRSDLLDEREQRIGRQLEANGVVLVVLGIVIGVGGLWIYARFRAIATEARIGSAAVRRYVLAPPGLLPGSVKIREQSDEALQPSRLLVSAGLEAESGTTASANRSFRGNLPDAAPVASLPSLPLARRPRQFSGPGRPRCW